MFSSHVHELQTAARGKSEKHKMFMISTFSMFIYEAGGGVVLVALFNEQANKELHLKHLKLHLERSQMNVPKVETNFALEDSARHSLSDV